MASDIFILMYSQFLKRKNLHKIEDLRLFMIQI